MAQKPKLYVAQRDSLRTHDGHIHAGEAYPAAEVTPALLNIGWVTEGVGTAPVDPGSHQAFATGELARHEPADPAEVKRWKQAQADAAALAALAAPVQTSAPTPAAPVKSGKAAPKAKSRRSRTGK